MLYLTHLCRSILAPITLFVDQKFTRLFSWNAALDAFFPILDILPHSGDIRDQIRKLLEIAPNFLPLQILCGGPSKTCLAVRRLEMFREDTPTSPRVIAELR